MTPLPLRLKAGAESLLERLPLPPRRALMRAGLRLLYEKEIRLLPRLCDPAKTSLDVGANRGMYAVFLPPLSSRTICFEPHPALASKLERLLHGLPGVEVRRAALGNTTGESTLQVPWIQTLEINGWGSIALDYEHGITSLDGTPWSRVEKIPVPIQRLDDIDCGPLGFVKIDIEGAEFQVLQGGLQTLDRFRPRLLIEIVPGRSSVPTTETVQLLSGLGYRPFVFQGNEVLPAPVQPGSEPATHNYIFLHPDHPLKP